MAIYFSRLSVISRARGHSAVAAAAYRAGARMTDERTGLTHDFRKKAGVLACEVIAPRGITWAVDASTLWNAAERAEKRSNARVARELIVALPAELSTDQQCRLARTIAADLVDSYGLVVMLAVHAPDKSADVRNVHVHLLMTTRVATEGGLGAKVRCLDDRQTGPVEAERMRTAIAQRINTALQENGHSLTVDPRRLAVQAEAAAARGDIEAVAKLTRAPTRHVGRAGTAARRRGESSALVDRNQEIHKINAEVCKRGRGRAIVLRADIAAQVALHRSGKRSVITRGNLRSGSQKYLEALRDTQQLIREQVRRGFQSDALRAKAIQDEIHGNAALSRAATTSRTMWEQVHRERRASPATTPATRPPTPRPARNSNSPGPQVMTRREWAELRRMQRNSVAGQGDSVASENPGSIEEKCAETTDKSKNRPPRKCY